MKQITHEQLADFLRLHALLAPNLPTWARTCLSGYGLWGHYLRCVDRTDSDIGDARLDGAKVTGVRTWGGKGRGQT